MLNETQKKFVQAMLARPLLTEGQALKLFAHVTGRNSGTKDQLETFVTQIHERILGFHVSIKQQICEVTHTKYYVLVSNFPKHTEIYDKAVHSYKPTEREYFRNIMEEIITSEERCIRRNAALNLTVAGGSQSTQSMGPHHYNQILEKFISDGWLVTLADEGKVFLGARAIAELEYVLTTTYQVSLCKLCSRACIQGFVCDVCNIWSHLHCLRTVGGKKSVRNNCIKCGSEMRRI